MNPPDANAPVPPDSGSTADPIANDPPTTDRPAPGGAIAAPSRSGRIWSMAVAAGLVGGLMAWLLAELAMLAVQPETEMLSAMGVMVEVVSRRGEIKANAMRSHVSSGLLGAALGLTFGLAGGLARRSTRDATVAGLTGLALGGLLGAAASFGLAPVYQAHRDADPLSTDLTVPLIVHGGMWGIAGLVGGLAFGLGLDGKKGTIASAAVGGLVGALLGTLAFEVLGAFLFPMDKTHMPVSNSWASRLTARMLVALIASAGIGAMLSRETTPRRRARRPAPSES